jgi:hypothetical protein
MIEHVKKKMTKKIQAKKLWQELHMGDLPVQSIPITTKVVCLNPAHS